MLAFLVTFLLVVGLNTLIWASVGIGRVIAAEMHAVRVRNARRVSTLVPLTDDFAAIESARAGRLGNIAPVELPVAQQPTYPNPGEVAVLIAAHNEESVIRRTVASASRLVEPDQIFVISDGSTDATAEQVRAAGANVLELTKNRGKAGALAAGVEEFDLATRFAIVLLLDADTELADDYFETGLPLFADPEVVAVAGRAATLVDPPARGTGGRILVAYRQRVYIAVQYLHKYGQAARRANVVSIVPGFASMYRASVLPLIDIAAPGLVIEDYNMTFEVHKKNLGKIAFHPHAAIAYTQDPDTFQDYLKQTRRWSLGFWQTVRRHRVRPGLFWPSLILFMVELLSSSLVIILVGPVIVLSLMATGIAAAGWDPSGAAAGFSAALPPLALILGVLIPDYILTIGVAWVTRDSRYLWFGICFPFLRLIDALTCVRALADTLFHSSNGTWQSPSRRVAQHVAGS
jgi:cellulose synthase/poly-beta-1,6-N-acetylglucosamine synthase-like glycosyltransferase